MRTSKATSFAMVSHTPPETQGIDGAIESIWKLSDLEQTALSAGRATSLHNAFSSRFAFDPAHRRGAHGVTLRLGIDVNPSSIIISDMYVRSCVRSVLSVCL